MHCDKRQRRASHGTFSGGRFERPWREEDDTKSRSGSLLIGKFQQDFSPQYPFFWKTPQKNASFIIFYKINNYTSSLLLTELGGLSGVSPGIYPVCSPEDPEDDGDDFWQTVACGIDLTRAVASTHVSSVSQATRRSDSVNSYCFDQPNGA